MTIAGAFWVGVLAARRLRQWGDSRPAVDGNGAQDDPRALQAGGAAPTNGDGASRVREAVAARLETELGNRPVPVGRQRGQDASTIEDLRIRDIVSIELPGVFTGDTIVDGLLYLREGGRLSIAVELLDARTKYMLLGGQSEDRWWLLRRQEGHPFAGEPPRYIEWAAQRYLLERRGQHSVAMQGKVDRPNLSRVATYLYRTSTGEVLWLERWGEQVLLFAGHVLSPAAVSFLPGS